MAGTTARKPRKTPTKTATRNPAEAEATLGTLMFTFRGVDFTIDYETADLSRAMFAFRMAINAPSPADGLSLVLDALEATLGKDQIQNLYRVCPEFFSSEEASKEFWNVWIEAVTGGDSGE